MITIHDYNLFQKEWSKHENKWWAANPWVFKYYNLTSDKIIVELEIHNIFWNDHTYINMYMPFATNEFYIKLNNSNININK